MYDDDQDVDELDQLLVCPYDANHRVAATRMNHHLVKCRKNYFVNESEKTICPFNAEHVIFSPEMDSHKILCPDKPEMMAEDVQTSDEKRAEDESDDVTVGEARQTKSQTNGESDLPTDEESDETGCIKGLKVGGLKEYNIDSKNGDPESTIIAVDHSGSCENDDKKPTQENGANGEFEDRLVNAVSHMAGIEPQDDNIAIEKQLSQSNGNIPSSENGVLTENTINGCPQEHFDYKKYAPSKEEREEFLQLIKQNKEEENLEDMDESLNQTYTTQPWQQNYSYLHQPYQTNQPYNPYTTTYITFPNGYQQVIGNMNGQSPYPTHFTFQQANGPPPQYMPQPVQGVNYDYNPGYAPRPKYRPQYRRRNYHQQNHSHNRHIHNGYHNHYNGYNHNNHCTRNHNNGYANSHDAYSHTDTDSNSSASGQSDIGVTEHGVQNCNGHHLDNHRVRNPRRTTHTPLAKSSANLEKVVCIITDSDGESGPSSVNGHMSDPSPDPSESCESLGKKGEKDKVVRKLRKKLSEINALDNKKNSGVKMDCDQLKKLTRKKELEDELAALTID